MPGYQNAPDEPARGRKGGYGGTGRKTAVRTASIILVVVLLIFGPKNLPKLGKMFGKTMNNFKKGMEESEEEDATTAKAETQTEKKDDEE